MYAPPETDNVDKLSSVERVVEWRNDSEGVGYAWCFDFNGYREGDGEWEECRARRGIRRE